MKFPFKFLFFILFVLLQYSSVFAEESATQAGAQNQVASKSAQVGVSATIPQASQPAGTANQPMYCPPITDLKKQDLFWHAQGIWRSYSQSFSNEIATFSGAQWLGIKVGKIVCMYMGKESTDFPVALETEKTMLIMSPTTSNWREERSGFKTCVSANINDCPFYLQPPEDDSANVYQDLKYQGTPGATINSEENLMFKK